MEEGGDCIEKGYSGVDGMMMLSSNVCFIFRDTFAQVEVGLPAHYFGWKSNTPTTRIPEQNKILSQGSVSIVWQHS